MNIDKDNNRIRSENPFVFFNRGEVFYRLKYSNLPIKLKVMLIKKFNEVVVSQKEIEDFNKKANHLLSYMIKEYDYNSIENPPLIYEELDCIVEDRSDIEKEKDFFNYKGIEYKPIDPEKTKKARDMLYKVIIRHMSCTDLSEHELRFIAEEAVSLEQMQKDNPFIINVWQQSALHLAVINNNMQEVKDILTKDKSMLGLKDRWGSTALHYAVELALLDITKYLIEEGANVFERNSDGDTLLHLATIEGNKDMISYLLEKGLYINALDNKLQAPLHWAVLMDNKETLSYLVEKGHDVDVRDKDKKTLLHLAYIYNRYDIATYLIGKGADVNAKDSILRTPLYYIIALCNKEQLEHIVSKGADINVEDKFKKTLLHIACSRWTNNETDSLATYLIEKGVDINAQDSKGKTALHLAVYRKYSNIIKILLEKGADPNVIDNNGNKPIHCISLYNDEVYKIIYNLLDHGTYLNEDEKYRRQNRALIYKIILNGFIDLFNKLLKIGVNIDNYLSLKTYKLMLVNKRIKDKEIENYIWNKTKELEEKKQNKEDGKGTDVDKGLVAAAGFLEYLLSKTNREENIFYVYLVNIVKRLNIFIKENYSKGYIRDLETVSENMTQKWREAYSKLGIEEEKLSSKEMFEVMIEFVTSYDCQYDIKELIELLKDILKEKDKYSELWKIWNYYIKKAEEYKVID